MAAALATRPAFRPARVLLGHQHTCTDATPDADVIEMPSLRHTLRHAGRTIMTASVIPSALFYVVLAVVGLQPAVAVTLAYYYLGIVWRLARRQRVLGAAVLGAGLMTLRSVTVFVTGSAYLYFLQPVAGTVLTATALAVTALAGRPLIDRLAHDFCPLPEHLAARLRARNFFGWTSAIWSVVYVGNAVGTVWLLSSASLGGFLVLKSVLGPVLTTVAVIGSYLVFRRLTRRDNVVVCWAPHTETG